MKKIFFLTLYILATLTASAQFQVSGKLRVLRPLDYKVQDLNGKIIVNIKIENGKEFKSKRVDIIPDLYKVTMGVNEELMFLRNEPLTMKGYFNDRDLVGSNMTTTGASANIEMKNALLKLNGLGGKPNLFLPKLEELKDCDPLILAAVIVNYNPNVYEPFKAIYDRLPKDNKSLIKEKLEELMHKKEAFKLGSEVLNFTLVDRDSKEVSLSNFKGKLVLLDFWASWCNPCRMEMKSLHKIHNEIKGDDLVFISISLDDDRNKWIKAMDTDNIPWVALWDKDGFKKSRFKELFGFNAIPFIVFIGKDGKTIIRNVRGEDVKNAIEKARNISK